MTKSDKKLKASLAEAMKLDDQKLEEEMCSIEPHVFSERFETNMRNLMETIKKRAKRRRIIRFAASAAALVIVLGSFITLRSKPALASELGISIDKWFDRFFSVESDSTEVANIDDKLFSEEQISYIPERFIQISKHESTLLYYYEYRCDDEDYFIIQVSDANTSRTTDNEDVDIKVLTSESGFAYTLISEKNGEYNTILWKDKNNANYYLNGNISIEEITQIMNGITY